MSSFRWGMIACKTPTNSQVTVWKLRQPLFCIKSGLFCLLLCTLSPPGVCQHLSLFWSVTLQPLGAEQSAVYHVKENSNTFHMRHSSMICTKGLQKYDSSLTLNNSCLVRNKILLPSLSIAFGASGALEAVLLDRVLVVCHVSALRSNIAVRNSRHRPGGAKVNNEVKKNLSKEKTV